VTTKKPSKAEQQEATADAIAADTPNLGTFTTAATPLDGGPVDKRFHDGDDQKTPDVTAVADHVLASPELVYPSDSPARAAAWAHDNAEQRRSVEAAAKADSGRAEELSADTQLYPYGDVRTLGSNRDGVTEETQARGVRRDTDAELEAQTRDDLAGRNALADAAQALATAARKA
jgi:hypothetical protein